jgi:hypothetical protein
MSCDNEEAYGPEACTDASRRSPAGGVSRAARPVVRCACEGVPCPAHAHRKNCQRGNRRDGGHRAAARQGARHVGLALAEPAKRVRHANGENSNRKRAGEDHACNGARRRVGIASLGFAMTGFAAAATACPPWGRSSRQGSRILLLAVGCLIPNRDEAATRSNFVQKYLRSNAAENIIINDSAVEPDV